MPLTAVGEIEAGDIIELTNARAIYMAGVDSGIKSLFELIPSDNPAKMIAAMLCKSSHELFWDDMIFTDLYPEFSEWNLKFYTDEKTGKAYLEVVDRKDDD